MKCILFVVLFLSCVIGVQGQIVLHQKASDTLNRHFIVFSSSVLVAKQPAPPVPADFYTQGFGFFCRQELHMQQAHFPLSVRVGSLDACNFLEGKDR